MSETFSTKNDVAPATQIHPHVARPRSIDGIDGLFWGMLLQSGCPSVFPHCSVLNSTIVYKGNSTGQETWFGNKHSHGIINGSQSRWMWDNFRCIEVLPLVINSFNDFKVHNFNTGYLPINIPTPFQIQPLSHRYSSLEAKCPMKTTGKLALQFRSLSWKSGCQLLYTYYTKVRGFLNHFALLQCLFSLSNNCHISYTCAWIRWLFFVCKSSHKISHDALPSKTKTGRLDAAKGEWSLGGHLVRWWNQLQPMWNLLWCFLDGPWN